MSEFSFQGSNEIERRQAVLTEVLQDGGLLHELAQTGLGEQASLVPSEVADIIMPPKQPGESREARWVLIEDAPALIKAAASEHGDRIFDIAEHLDMRRDASLTERDIARINTTNAIWLVEGGANRTSVVRRELAVQAMRRVYTGVELAEHPLYQFGGDRWIPRERKGKPNPEYAVATEIAGGYLPSDDTLTEFDLNVASALQAGYEKVIEETELPGVVVRVVRLHRADAPELVLMQPCNQRRFGGELSDAFHAIHKVADITGGQFVIATNGQYRPKDEWQAQQWADQQSVTMQPAVAIGDEPGFQVEHNGATITTAERQPMAYVNEMVVLQRLQR